MKPDLFVPQRNRIVQHPVGFDENNALLFPVFNPKNEVGIKTRPFKKPNATASGEIAQQEDLLALESSVFLFLAIVPKAFDKLLLPPVKARWGYCDRFYCVEQ